MRYARPNLPPIAWKNFKIKQTKVNTTLKQLGFKKRIPLTKLIYAISQKNIYFEDAELIKLANGGRK